MWRLFSMLGRKRALPVQITVTHPAAAKMFRIAQRALPNESGGVLIGTCSETGALISVTVGPGPKALHGPTSFTRDGEYAQLHVERHRRQSPGQLDYVAEWHSHPLPCAPSPTDSASMRAISRSPEYRRPIPLLVLCILASSGAWELRGYTYRGRRLQEVALVITDAETSGSEEAGHCNTEPGSRAE